MAKDKWPGVVAIALLTLATSLWTFWGAGELYLESIMEPHCHVRCATGRPETVSPAGYPG